MGAFVVLAGSSIVCIYFYVVSSAIFINIFPYPNPSQLYSVNGMSPRLAHGSFLLSSSQAKAIGDSLAPDVDTAWFSTTSAVFSAGALVPRQTLVLHVSPNFFRTMGVPPTLGTVDRGISSPAHCQAVIGEELWTTVFHHTPNVIGSHFVLDEHDCVVAAVMPPTFSFPSPKISLWQVVTQPTPNQIANEQVIVRIASPDRLEDVIANLQRLGTSDGFPGKAAFKLYDEYLGVTSLREEALRSLAVTSTFFYLCIGLIEAMGLMNAAGLMLASYLNRTSELAIRITLGAGRRRLLSMLTREALICSLGAQGISCCVLFSTRQLVASLVAKLIHRPAIITMNRGILLFCVSTSVIQALFVITLVYIVIAAVQPYKLLSGSGVIANSPGVGEAQKYLHLAMLSLQLGLSMVCFVYFGLSLAVFYDQVTIRTGVSLHGLYGIQMDNNMSPPSIVSRLALLRATPGISDAAIATLRPFNGTEIRTSFLAYTGRGSQMASSVELQSVSPNYFHLLGIPLVSGTTFDSIDVTRSHCKLVVNESLARLVWQGESPVGYNVDLNLGTLPTAALCGVVGVVRDVRDIDRLRSPQPEAYFSFPTGRSLAFALVVRSHLSPTALKGIVENAFPISEDVKTPPEVSRADDLMDLTIAPARRSSDVLATLFCTVFVLFLCGLYGAVAVDFEQRKREIGVRIALGAQGRDLMRLQGRRICVILAGGYATGMLLLLLSHHVEMLELHHASRTARDLLIAVAMLGAVISCSSASKIALLRLNIKEPLALIR